MALSDADTIKWDIALQYKKLLPADSALLCSDKSLPSDADEVNSRDGNYGDRKLQKFKHFEDEEIQAIIAGYQSGQSVYELASQFDCHRVTVSNVLKRHGVIVDKCKWREKLPANEVVAMYAAKQTAQEIADRFGVSRQVVILCLRENGVRIRGRWDY